MNPLSTPLDQIDLATRIDNAECEAEGGCGQSDVLYEDRVQVAYARILAAASEDHRAETETALRARGFCPDFESFEAGPDECNLTGVDTNCCPCGQHE